MSTYREYLIIKTFTKLMSLCHDKSITGRIKFRLYRIKLNIVTRGSKDDLEEAIRRFRFKKTTL